MQEIIESKYLRYRYNKYINEYRELYRKAKEIADKDGFDAKWNNLFKVKDVINDFKKKSELTYEEFVENFFLIDSDVAKAINEFDDYSLVIYRIMEKTGCTYGDARNYHYHDFINFLNKVYNKNKEIKNKYGNVVIDDEFVKSIKTTDLSLLKGYTIEHVINNIMLFHPDEIDEIMEYLEKKRKLYTNK